MGQTYAAVRMLHLWPAIGLRGRIVCSEIMAMFA